MTRLSPPGTNKCDCPCDCDERTASAPTIATPSGGAQSVGGASDDPASLIPTLEDWDVTTFGGGGPGPLAGPDISFGSGKFGHISGTGAGARGPVVASAGGSGRAYARPGEGKSAGPIGQIAKPKFTEEETRRMALEEKALGGPSSLEKRDPTATSFESANSQMRATFGAGLDAAAAAARGDSATTISQAQQKMLAEAGVELDRFGVGTDGIGVGGRESAASQLMSPKDATSKDFKAGLKLKHGFEGTAAERLADERNSMRQQEQHARQIDGSGQADRPNGRGRRALGGASSLGAAEAARRQRSASARSSSTVLTAARTRTPSTATNGAQASTPDRRGASIERHRTVSGAEDSASIPSASQEVVDLARPGVRVVDADPGHSGASMPRTSAPRGSSGQIQPDGARPATAIRPGRPVQASSTPGILAFVNLGAATTQPNTPSEPNVADLTQRHRGPGASTLIAGDPSAVGATADAPHPVTRAPAADYSLSVFGGPDPSTSSFEGGLAGAGGRATRGPDFESAALSGLLSAQPVEWRRNDENGKQAESRRMRQDAVDRIREIWSATLNGIVGSAQASDSPHLRSEQRRAIRRARRDAKRALSREIRRTALALWKANGKRGPKPSKDDSDALAESLLTEAIAQEDKRRGVVPTGGGGGRAPRGAGSGLGSTSGDASSAGDCECKCKCECDGGGDQTDPDGDLESPGTPVTDGTGGRGEGDVSDSLFGGNQASEVDVHRPGQVGVSEDVRGPFFGKTPGGRQPENWFQEREASDGGRVAGGVKSRQPMTDDGPEESVPSETEFVSEQLEALQRWAVANSEHLRRFGFTLESYVAYLKPLLRQKYGLFLERRLLTNHMRSEGWSAAHPPFTPPQLRPLSRSETTSALLLNGFNSARIDFAILAPLGLTGIADITRLALRAAELDRLIADSGVRAAASDTFVGQLRSDPVFERASWVYLGAARNAYNRRHNLAERPQGSDGAPIEEMLRRGRSAAANIDPRLVGLPRFAAAAFVDSLFATEIAEATDITPSDVRHAISELQGNENEQARDSRRELVNLALVSTAGIVAAVLVVKTGGAALQPLVRSGALTALEVMMIQGMAGEAAYTMAAQSAELALGAREGFDWSEVGINAMVGIAVPPIGRAVARGARSAVRGLDVVSGLVRDSHAAGVPWRAGSAGPRILHHSLNPPEELFFRGTTRGFAGGESTGGQNITPSTSDPRVAVAFAAEAADQGEAVIHIATRQDLRGVALAGENWFDARERAVNWAISPTEFARRASLRDIPVKHARQLLADLGHRLPPARLQRGESTPWLLEWEKTADPVSVRSIAQDLVDRLTSQNVQ